MGAGTFFYVHGSGNRDADAARYAVTLREGLGLALGSDQLRVSNWGAAAGPDLTFPLLADVLPHVPAGAVGGPIEPAATDYLAPLKSLAPPAGLVPSPPAPRPESDRVLALLQAGVTLPEAGVNADSLRQAALETASSPEYAEARGSEEQLTDALARSVVARAIQLEPGGAPAGIGLNVGALATRIGDGVAALAAKLLGAAGSVLYDTTGWDLGAEAKLALSKRLALRRYDLTLRALPVPGDVLFYERRGGAIRDHVRAELTALPRPIVALGHSLGAIILVDTLFGPDATDSGVEELVTFGAQSAMLKTIGAIDAVNPTDIRWTNVWTRYDFISFLAGELWSQAVDVEVPIAVGFPDAHGACYESPDFYAAVVDGPIAASIVNGDP